MHVVILVCGLEEIPRKHSLAQPRSQCFSQPRGAPSLAEKSPGNEIVFGVCIFFWKNLKDYVAVEIRESLMHIKTTPHKGTQGLAKICHIQVVLNQAYTDL